MRNLIGRKPEGISKSRKSKVSTADIEIKRLINPTQKCPAEINFKDLQFSRICTKKKRYIYKIKHWLVGQE